MSRYITINLQQPFWSAYQKYNWYEGVEGFGINERLVEKAFYENKKLRVVYKDASYEITPKKAKRIANFYQSIFIARDGTKLLVIPRNKLKRLPDIQETIDIPLDYRLRLRDIFREKVSK